jgi:DNA (cytosine-5)-methyltransferase 1
MLTTDKLSVLDLFSGIGGFSLGLERTGGFETKAFCEIDPFCRRVLAKHWPEVKQYDDIRNLTADQLRADGIAPDVICGGFPCQDVSLSGGRDGLDGERSGLWREYARLIREIRPALALVENTPGLLSLGMDRVLGDLSELGYDAEWRVIRAADLGLPTVRRRLWIAAFPMRSGWQGCLQHIGAFGLSPASSAERRNSALRERTALVNDLHGIPADHGFSVTMERQRIRQFGNAVVPQIPELIGNAILESMRAAA